MRLTDLQWQINRILLESSLSKDEQAKVQLAINAEIARFGSSLIQVLEIRLGK